MVFAIKYSKQGEKTQAIECPGVPGDCLVACLNNELMKFIVMEPVDYVAVKCACFRSRENGFHIYSSKCMGLIVPILNFCYIIVLDAANSRLSASRIVKRRK